jgi:hypothetical protein
MAAARVLVIILVISPLPSSHVEPFKKIVHLIQSNAQGEKDAGDGEYYIPYRPGFKNHRGLRTTH